MNILKKNEGTGVAISLKGNLLSFSEGRLTLNLEDLQCNHAVHITISSDISGRLVIGPSHRYIAEIDIPARRYIIQAGAKDDLGFPLLRKKAVPLDPASVTVTLWATE